MALRVVGEGRGHGGHSGGRGEGFGAVAAATPLRVCADDLGPSVWVWGLASLQEGLNPRHLIHETQPLHARCGAGHAGTFRLRGSHDGLWRGGSHAKGHLGVVTIVPSLRGRRGGSAGALGRGCCRQAVQLSWGGRWWRLWLQGGGGGGRAWGQRWVPGGGLGGQEGIQGAHWVPTLDARLGGLGRAEVEVHVVGERGALPAVAARAWGT